MVVMSALPPHVTGRPLRPRRDERSIEDSFHADLQFRQRIPMNLPSQSDDYHLEHGHHGHQLLRPQIETGLLPSGNTNIDMGGLEVGVPRPQPYTEQTSDGTAQRALAAMLRDADRFEANEKRFKTQRRDSVLMESASFENLAPHSKQQKTDTTTRGPKQPLHSFAATQPSSHLHQLVAPVSSTSTSAQSHNAPAPQAPHESEPPIKPWQIHSDPKGPKHPSPTHHNKGIQCRENDVDSQEPNVNSCVRMTSLPFGTMIEVACDYDAQVDDDGYLAPC